MNSKCYTQTDRQTDKQRIAIYVDRFMFLLKFEFLGIATMGKTISRIDKDVAFQVQISWNRTHENYFIPELIFFKSNDIKTESIKKL